MKAVVYDSFRGPIELRDVVAPSPGNGEVVVRVKATGVCRSDWHGWQGHDPDINELPHVPGHEMAGEIAEVGRDIEGWAVGDRVVVPFVAGCGVCEFCLGGNPQVCPNQTQPGFTHWGSFAEYVRVRHAQNNLVALPSDVDFASAASLGCRFTTAYRALVDRASIRPGEWVAVHGCGGVGLSAVMIASALGGRVIAVDVSPAALEMATQLGAEVCVRGDSDVVESIVATTGGGAHVSVDAFGSPSVIENAIGSLRRRGRHVQVGLIFGDQASSPLPMGRIIAWELDVLGSHGAQASVFPGLFDMIAKGQINPGRLVTSRLTLDEGAGALMNLDSKPTPGVAVIEI